MPESRRRHIMSPLILLIFITCGTSVLSSIHKIRHHRDRFKRQQGAHLYLAGSYVYEGGEGPDAGPWTDWSGPSACSRTCGGGVSTEVRQCSPGYSCQGPTHRHFSCNTQDCPDFGDFRAQQCSEFDNVPFSGVVYQWVPYTKAPNPCELNCMPRGDRFYYRHGEQVVDGTRCNDESFDVCISGKCQPVGCDMMLGSYAREDKCRKCGGDGSTCNTVTGRLDMQDLQVGYNDILLIPAGATNIAVHEIAPSNNYLAVRNTSGYHYFNGNWRIDFPRTLDVAGCKMHYERSPHGFSAPDQISCLGPIDESIFIVLLKQDVNVGVDYEYSLPNNIQPGYETEAYAWTFDQFTPCSQTCGGGVQFRNVSCAGRKSLEPVDKSLCDANNEPASTQRCAEIPCEAQWAPYPWGNCSSPCGEGGVQTREIACQQLISSGYPSLVENSLCEHLPKPPQQQSCNKGRVCASWHTGPWKPCSHLCGPGKETRVVTCYRKNNSKIEIFDDSECTPIEPKPVDEKPCNLKPCEGVDWITSVWSGCDKCGLTNETRKVICATANGQSYPDNLCDSDQKPLSVRQCNGTKPSCIYQWYASQWSECSAQCGQGVQTRTLFCGLLSDDGSVSKVQNDKCDQKASYETIRNCTGEIETCGGEWYSGPWTECSKACGGGERSKKVVCLKDLEVVDASFCGPDKIIFGKEECNLQPCSEDTIIPTDITKPVDESEGTESTTEEIATTEPADIDDSEWEIVPADECEDGEWVTDDNKSATRTDKLGSNTETGSTDISPKETGLSEDDLMFNDAPAVLDDDKFSTVVGSGNGELSSISSVFSEETTFEGSGTSETETAESTDISKSTDILLDTDTVITADTESSITPEISSSLNSESTDLTKSSSETSPITTDVSTQTDAKTETSKTEAQTKSSSDFTSDADLSSGSQVTTKKSTTIKKEEVPSVIDSPDIDDPEEEEPSEFIPVKEETTAKTLTTISLATSATEEFSSLSTRESQSTTESDSTIEISSTVDIKPTSEASSNILTDSSVETSETSETEKATETSAVTEAASTILTESSIKAESTTEASSSIKSDSSTEASETSETKYTTDIDTTGTGSTTAESSLKSDSTTEASETSNTSSFKSDSTAETSEFSKTSSSSETESTTEAGSSSETGTTTEAGSTTIAESTTETSSTIKSDSTTGTSSSFETDATTELSSTIFDEDSTTETKTTLEGSSTETSSNSILSSTIEVTSTVEAEASSTSDLSSTTEASSTSGASSTTNADSTVEASSTTETGSTFETSSTSESGSTTELFSSSTETDKLSSLTSSTDVSESSTELSKSSESLESTSPEITDLSSSVGSTTELTGSTGTTEFDIWSSTQETDITEESTEWETTPLIDIFAPRKLRMCKRRKKKTCKNTQFGCCSDKITAAEGPFDKGCSNPKTCNESRFGCCEDGVSPAFDKNFKGCPISHCNETLFGCCSDNKTIAEGNNNEGCPPPPPACLKSEFGCCEDNVTEAQGSNYKGCKEDEEQEVSSTTTEETTAFTQTTEDCTNSKYGCCPDQIQAADGEFYEGCVIENCTESYFRCCPDGVTPAAGPNYHGCQTLCSNNTFGCCPDGLTPAHGYNREGCCLASTYGCCPDNILAARGPNLEGCGCQYSPYRCCPDNITAARGHNNEGCGCQYTEFGCCPDEYTPAEGPEYKNCLCHTFQFGCCPDGVTVARGPHQQGCGCQNTEFKCCSDDSTPARGPNFEGCDCLASKYGCCPDGVTEAQGENFEDCENVPEDLQDSCHQPKQRGSCRNYTVKWFFDMEYGGCSRFWFGGCDGNSNRFKSKEDCDAICVKPQGTDRCKLPKVTGPCEGYYPQWYYDKDRKHCTQFVYGGCLGNNNRFETRDECQALCATDSSQDVCEQEKEEGPCHGNYLRWYFDKKSKTCEQFIYGGCKSNQNNFPTEEACKQQCAHPGLKKDHCSLPQAQGNCTGREPKWYYDKPKTQCLPFYYSGCNGNNNNFGSREACEVDCPKEIRKDLCQLAADVGNCGNYEKRWYFDTRDKQCRQFYYGGCDGNGNNFENEEQCIRRCDKSQPPPAITPPSTDGPAPEPFRTEMCFLPSEVGNCRAAHLRYFYDRSDGVCKRFNYGGCGGNRNNFESVEGCIQNCGNAQDLCLLPPIVGPCRAEREAYYYDGRTDQCELFKYGGCEGNFNRFPDKGSCEQRCKKSTPGQEVVPQTQAPPVIDARLSSICEEQPDPGNCTDNLSVFFYDSSTKVCTPFTYTGCGGNANRFSSEEQCERQCGSFRGQDVCNMPQDAGPCRGYFVKYYYDKNVGRCGQFAFGGCGGNGNRFSSNEDCEAICMTHQEKRTNVTSTAVCKLPVDKGSCQDGYHKRWYFDNDRGQCIAFIFTGCGGNLNNFKTFQSCVDFCRDYLVVTQPPISPEDHPCQAFFDECVTLRCAYGIEAYVDDNQCNRCQCQNPCSKVDCPSGSQCAIDINRNKTSSADPDFIAICRQLNKEGQCPNLEHQELTDCEQECTNDADCPLQLKCCSTGCGTSCIEPIIHVPAELVTQQPQPAYTEPPIQSIFIAPKIDVEHFKPEVQAAIGDQAVLRCSVTGNPTPKITWRKDDLLIDGTQAKYRIKLDQSLQIITLHKTDSGIYLCTADNSIGEPITNKIVLQVVDGPQRSATILEPEVQPNVVVSLNAPATLHCMALGYPFPAVTWWKDDSFIPLKTNQFEVRKDYSLVINSVKLSNLGIYTCQAYNGFGKAASWSVAIRAKGPYHSINPKDQKYLKYIVDPPELPTTTVAPLRIYSPYVEPPINNEINPNNNQGPEPQPPQPSFSVPVQTKITSGSQRFPTNADIAIPCIVDGYPVPQIQWYKDGVTIITNDRIQISGDNILTILQATKADSGAYRCEAWNAYSKSSSSVTLSVDEMYIHPNCKDNRFFANCNLIVKAKVCTHRYYAKFCCRSCTEAGLLPVDGTHLQNSSKQSTLLSNLV